MGFVSELSLPHVLSAILALYVGFLISQKFPADKTKPPVLFHWVPFVGSAVTYGLNPYKFWTEARKQYGDVFSFVLLGRQITVALGSKGNELVFNGKLSHVSAEEAYDSLTTPVFGEGVVYDVPNSVLMEHKKFMKFGLTTETFRTYVPLIANEVREYFATSPKFNSNSGGVVDVALATPEITIFTASRALQGKEVRAKMHAGFADLFHDLDRGFSPVNFIMPWFPWPQNVARDRAQKIVAKNYMEIIERRRANPGDDTEKDMIWNLMNQTYKNGEAVSDKKIAHMMIALLMAGQHTSSATSSWALLHLAEKPELIEELLQEQKDVLGADLPDPTYEQLKDLKLHNYVVRETLRMHPPLHSIMRKVVKPLSIEGTKYVIPEGNYVLAAPGMTSKDDAYFPNASNFDPWRWDTRAEDKDELVDYGYGLVSKGTASPYLPFGAGRHRCIGEQFAYLQLVTILAIMSKTYKWHLPPGQKSIPGEDYTSMVVLPKRPSNIVVEKR